MTYSTGSQSSIHIIYIVCMCVNCIFAYIHIYKILPSYPLSLYIYIVENTAHPIWNQTFNFTISKPFLRFEVINDPDNFVSEFMGQATYPLMSLREGFRCLQLKDSFNEALELAKLLVHIQVCIQNETTSTIPT